MDVADYIGYVASEGDRFANAVEQGDLSAEIPGCEGWDLRDLVRHLGLIHLWAAANVAFPTDQWLDVNNLSDLAKYWPKLASSWPGDAELASWYRRTHRNLVRVLKSAPADLDCFTFLPAPTPLTMWSRRQASEIAIHRFDAETSSGAPSVYEPTFAADMLDELLTGFAPGPTEIDVKEDRVLHVHAEDVNENWYLTITPYGIETSRFGDTADLTATGTATDLYLLFWNRLPDSAVALAGDISLLATWHTSQKIRWSGA